MQQNENETETYRPMDKSFSDEAYPWWICFMTCNTKMEICLFCPDLLSLNNAILIALFSDNKSGQNIDALI